MWRGNVSRDADSGMLVDVQKIADRVLRDQGIGVIVMLLQCYGSSGTRKEQEPRWSVRIIRVFCLCLRFDLTVDNTV